jgi:hypothetical protein
MLFVVFELVTTAVLALLALAVVFVVVLVEGALQAARLNAKAAVVTDDKIIFCDFILLILYSWGLNLLCLKLIFEVRNRSNKA